MSPRRPTIKPPKHHYGGGGAASGSRAKGDHSHYGGVENPLSHPPARAHPGTSGHDHHAAPRPKPHQGTHASTATKKVSLSREHAAIAAFDAGSYTATIILARAPDASLSGIPVSRAISSGLLTVGATVAVLFFDAHNSADAMIVGVY